VSQPFYDFVYGTERSSSNTECTIAKIYNYIYLQVFHLLWKPRCTLVVNYETQLGVTNRDKRSAHRTVKFNYQPKQHILLTPDLPADSVPRPWVDWFTASIRQGSQWLSHVYSPRVDKFRSFTTSAINSFTDPYNQIVSSFNLDSTFRLNNFVTM